MERSAGILLHITSLPSPYGIGTLGKEAFAFVDFLKKAGQTWWQILPIGPTGYGDSPYQPFSAFAGNPYLIDLDTLCEKGLLKKEELGGVNFGTSPRHVDYGKQYENRLPLLRKAFGRCPRAELMEFAARRPRLGEYALFMALKDHFDGAPYAQWPAAIRLREPDAMAKYRRKLGEDILYYVFLQYEFFAQFAALKAYANENGIRLIGDVPIYLPADCADVWAEPELFVLDKDLLPREVAGVPPDYFSEEGQLWGNPLYHWANHKENGFAWWRERMGTAFTLFDGVRLDHFRGFADYYAIPYGETTAKNGRWLDGPGMAFVEAMQQVAQGRCIIAEDLGDLSDTARGLLIWSGLPGMKVLQFAFGSGAGNAYLPHNYAPNCVCYAGTHDNDTTAGWLAEADEDVLAQLAQYAGKADVQSVLRLGQSSVADLFIAQMQDYLELDASCRMNTPGTDKANWQFRLLPGELTDELAERICRMTETFGR